MVHWSQPEPGAQLCLGALGDGGFCWLGVCELILPRRGFCWLGVCGLIPPRGGVLHSFLLRVRAAGAVAGLFGGLLWGLFGGLFGRQRARSRHTPSVGGGFIEGAPTYCVL